MNHSVYLILIQDAMERNKRKDDAKVWPEFVSGGGGGGGWSGVSGTAHKLKLGQASTAVSVTRGYFFTVCPLELPAAADHARRHRFMIVFPETLNGIWD